MSYEPIQPNLYSATPIQKNLIDSSGPVEHSILASDGSLWLLTTATLWRWYPITGVVQKINPGMDLQLSGTERALGKLGDGIFIAVNGQVWRFSTGSGNVDRFAGSWDSSCKNVRFWGDSDFFGVASDCGVWRIDRYGKTLTSVLKKPWTKSDVGIAYNPTCKCLWIADGRTLTRVKLANGGGLKFDEMYEAKAAIVGITQSSEQMIAWTSYALLVFDADSGKRLQVVPSAGSRRIVSAVFGANLHAIVFHDGTMEWMAPKSKKAWTSRVSPQAGMRLGLDPGEAFAVLYLPHQLPEVFNLESFN